MVDLVANAELFAVDEDLFELFVVADRQVDLDEGAESQLDYRYLAVLGGRDLDLLEEENGLLEPEHPNLLQEDEEDAFAVLVYGNLDFVLDPLEKTVAFAGFLLELFEEESVRAVVYQLSVKLLSQNVLEIGVGVNVRYTWKLLRLYPTAVDLQNRVEQKIGVFFIFIVNLPHLLFEGSVRTEVLFAVEVLLRGNVGVDHSVEVGVVDFRELHFDQIDELLLFDGFSFGEEQRVNLRHNW